MKNKFLVLLSISILLSSIIISYSLIYSINKISDGVLTINATTTETTETQSIEPQFKLIREGSNTIIFNEYTGEYWEKFIPNDEGPTEWEKGDSPVYERR